MPEPSTLMGFNTDKILLQPEGSESLPVANARWGDNLPILVQAKVVQSFENAGYTQSVSRTRDGLTGDYQLLIDIRRFHISTAKDAAADIDFVAKLANKDGKIIAASTFQATAPAKSSDAQAYVDAFDAGLHQARDRLGQLDRDHACRRAAAGRRACACRAAVSRTAACRAVGGRPRPAPDSLKPLRVGLPRLQPAP